MSIGTSFFHNVTTRNLSQVNERISDLQGQISSGVNDPRPSADPVRALRLSAAKEQQEALDRYSNNLERAGARLDQADTVLSEAGNVMRRVGELALRAASDTATATERDSIGTEVRALRDSLLGLANARDESGRALFGGYGTQSDPFRDGPGGVVYQGDGGQSRLQVSESLSLPTGLSGDAVFAIGSEGGDVFAVIDDFLASLGTASSAPRASVTGAGQLDLDLTLSRAPAAWSMTLEGPLGSTTIPFVAAEGAMSGAVEAINAQTAATGISAALDPETGGLMLTAQGDVKVSNIARAPDTGGVLMVARDAEGGTQALVPFARTRDAVIDRLRGASEHLIDQRTQLGALSADAARQSDVIDNRKLAMSQAVSGLEDLDLANALTRLQQSMLTRDATQQAYVRITQQSLFDFLR
ncbi:Flagellar hook-associated protein 3 [Roseovarius sp. EC-HK134]|uniref:Flagellar hook-associated protein 3 n=1 Tax=Roseovarius mucosus TaxID=215743 RepID=A0A1V0RSD2_9RHOB|nr:MULTISPECIES: flagellar hook-associated protein FlgL [Roseovarius]ARE84673.1 flagellar hook-associated protein 3 [Roseovarius mucosus]MBW4973958.1 flagellar hook-associated protein FlgL [Roseovarius mucosus]VVT20622.1 Flagellar hook-associated protein 3 [Roseovarius sp. EC-SD190]VVT20733.1 Flagellar hook-associated protein 3 [Roseovarius sp. EC-HK134]|tara:strand:- start:1748 stop:2986 length:1239 start_codon:yes stop_codon:yes gene_type:complete